LDTLEFPYKPKPRIMLIGALLFAALGGFAAMEAMTNERGLVLERLIHLSPQGATIFYWSLAAACALLVPLGLASFAAGFVGRRYVRLTSTELSAPRFAWSKSNTVVALADILDIAVQSVQKQRFLHVHYRGGRLTINQSFLPSRDAFEQLREAIVARARGAS
jgi:hypothetical protein